MASPTPSGSLSRLIFASTCLAALLPAGALAAWWLLMGSAQQGPADDPQANRALAEAHAFSDALERWVGRTERELRAWGEVPAVVEGVRLAAVEHHERGYTEETPEDVNAQLVHERHLGLAPQADEYLAVQVARSEAWAKAHFSDEYGFTVGVAGLEEDFVQTDETWWQAAWAHGRYEGGVDFDDNVGGWGLRVALRIDDPATDAAVGVIEGVVALDAIQALADAFSRGGRNSIRILSEAGQLLAETASGHARDRIVRLSVEAMAEEGWRSGAGSAGHAGGGREGGLERGWVRLSGAEGPHRDWLVIVERAAGGVSMPATARYGAAAALALALLLGLGGGALVRRKTVPRLQRLAAHAERMGRGEVRDAIADPGNDEIAHLAQGLEQARGTVRRALQIIGRQRRDRQHAE